jgi:3-methyladenine DNA glycosylase AlkD
MNKTEVMKALKDAGSAQTLKTYRRHGVAGECFGVRYGDLYKIVKRIGIDQKLAEQLWATGNHDARTVATMIADPASMTMAVLDAWARTASNQLSLDAIAGLASKTKHARKCFEKWIDSKHEWTAAAGWHLLAAGCCGRPGEVSPEIADMSEAYFESYLDHIERHIHGSPNRVRHSMNAAVIAIGLRNPALQKKAIAAAKRIGKVEVDHGDTSCVTPDAEAYILKAAARQAKKKTTSKKSAAKKAGARKKTATGKAASAPRKNPSKKKATTKRVSGRTSR